MESKENERKKNMTRGAQIVTAQNYVWMTDILGRVVMNCGLGKEAGKRKEEEKQRIVRAVKMLHYSSACLLTPWNGSSYGPFPKKSK